MRLDLRTCYLDFVSPRGKGDLSSFLERHGPAPYELALESRDLKATTNYLREAGLSTGISGYGTAVTVSPKNAHDVRLSFV